MRHKLAGRGAVVWKTSTLSPDLASFRFRALYPSMGLGRLGFAAVLTDRSDLEEWIISGCSALVIAKSFSRADIEYSRAAHANGISVYFDLCDNIYIKEYRTASGFVPSEALLKMRQYLSGITVPTQTLAGIVSREMGDLPVYVIPDCCETPDLRVGSLEYLTKNALGNGASGLNAHDKKLRIWLKKISRVLPWRAADRVSGKRVSGMQETCMLLERERALGPVILWFGNHGSPWGEFGISDILIFRDALEQASRIHSARLVVISNSAEKYEKLIKPLSIPSLYLEWSPATVEAALKQAGLVIAPNSRDAFSLCKSSNRTLMALAAGVPVVATATPALEDLKDAVWLDDPVAGVSSLLTDPALAERHIARGRKLIAEKYSLDAIARTWKEVLFHNSSPQVGLG